MAKASATYGTLDAFTGTIARPQPPTPPKPPKAPKQKKTDSYEQKFRLSYSPRTAVVMARPAHYGNRKSNLLGTTSGTGLADMHGGLISANASRKIRNAIEWLHAAAEDKYLYSKKSNRFYKWKLSFLTLTLPTQGSMTDIQVKSILNSFLTLAKYNYGLHSYIWKAEPQSRGVIHFHLTSDCYMWKNSVRFEWNRLLSKHGLLNGHSNAPSTKIHSTYRVKNMAAYLTKYFIKPSVQKEKAPFLPIVVFETSRGNYFTRAEFCSGKTPFYIRPITGRLWGCSQSLSQARNMSYIVDVPEMRAFNGDLRDEGAKEIQKAYCNFFHLPKDYYKNLGAGQLKHDYLAHLLKIRKRKNFHQFEIYDGSEQQVTDKRIIAKFHKLKQKN